jgi:hypothetical protein
VTFDIEKFLRLSPNNRYLDVDYKDFIYVWNDTLSRVEAVAGCPTKPNASKRDHSYMRKWFDRETYQKINPEHKSVNIGHIVARNLGGLDHTLNLVRQNAKANNKEYANAERIARQPDTTFIVIALRYDNFHYNTQVPSSFDFYIEKNNREGTVYTIPNIVNVNEKEAMETWFRMKETQNA